MPAKYRGKYKKCRTCKNVIEIWNVMVEVTEDCPRKLRFSSGNMVTKEICEECEDWSKLPRINDLIES